MGSTTRRRCWYHPSVTAPRISSLSLRSLALPGLLLFLGSWGVWAILLDQHPEYSDTMFYDAINLWRSFVAWRIQQSR